jgi:hypothetical protein
MTTCPRKEIELKFEWLPGLFAIVKLPAATPVPDWALTGAFTSVTRTSDELSIVCPADNLPSNVNSESRWTCFKLRGPFAFSQVGILAASIDPLAERGVPIFAIATYDTDYILVREESCGAALGALQAAGHDLLGDNESGRKLMDFAVERRNTPERCVK